MILIAWRSWWKRNVPKPGCRSNITLERRFIRDRCWCDLQLLFVIWWGV